MILQLEDDHYRLAVASLVATSETSEAAVQIFDKGSPPTGSRNGS